METISVYLTTMVQLTGKPHSLKVVITNLTKETKFVGIPFFFTSPPMAMAKEANLAFLMTEPLQGISFPFRLESGQQVEESYLLTGAFLNSLTKEFKNREAVIYAFVKDTFGNEYRSNDFSIDKIIK